MSPENTSTDASPAASGKGFLKSFFNACRGPENFGIIREYSVLRIIWHAILLSICCSIIVAVGSSGAHNRRIQAIQQLFVRNFGQKLLFSSDGIVPEKAPDHYRTLELPDKSLLIYTGNGVVPPETMLEAVLPSSTAIVWSPLELRLFVKNDTVWLVNIIPTPGVYKRDDDDPNGKKQNDEVLRGYFLCRNQQEMLDLLKFENPAPKTAASTGVQKIPAEKIFQWVKIFLATFCGLGFFLRAASLLLLEITLLSLIYYFIPFSNLRTKPGLSFRQFWALSIYSAFPVLFVASLFPALNLWGAGYYNQIFFIGWVIYLSIVLRHNAADENLRPKD